MTTTSTSAPARAQRSDHDPLRLVVEDQLVPTVDGSASSLDQPRPRGEHAGARRGARGGGALRALVLEHPSRGRLPLAGREPRLRGRARGGRRLRRCRRRSGRRARAQHDRGPERARIGVAPSSRVLCSSMEHHANLLPWRRHDLEMMPFADSPEELLETCERDARPSALPAVRPARRDGRVERDGRALADPRAGSAGARARRADRRRRRPARAAPGDQHARPRHRPSSRSRVTSCTRPTAPAR